MKFGWQECDCNATTHEDEDSMMVMLTVGSLHNLADR